MFVCWGGVVGGCFDNAFWSRLCASVFQYCGMDVQSCLESLNGFLRVRLNLKMSWSSSCTEKLFGHHHGNNKPASSQRYLYSCPSPLTPPPFGYTCSSLVLLKSITAQQRTSGTNVPHEDAGEMIHMDSMNC